jgi:glycosyltransferase involved in cell wall biosynthesis
LENQEYSFSVIITTFNRSELLARCLDSLCGQNYPKDRYEIIIVNNNSTDNTEDTALDIIDKHPETNIRYYFVPRSGQVYARQIGILAARNEILSFTDDDGLLVAEWLSEVNKVFNMSDEIAGVAGKINILWDKEPPEWVRDYEEQLGKLDYGNEEKYEEGLYMNAGNLHIKKKILVEVGGFNPEMVGEWLIGDGETGLWLRLKKRNMKIGWAPKALMHHCQMVDKNATIEDIKRRFMNNGICIPYNIYAIDRMGKSKLVKNMLYAAKQSMKWRMRKLKHLIASNKKSALYATFRTAFYYAQIGYSLKILSNKEFRTALTKNDWSISQNSKSAVIS